MAAALSLTFGRGGALIGNLVFGFLIDLNCVVPIVLFAAMLFSKYSNIYLNNSSPTKTVQNILFIENYVYDTFFRILEQWRINLNRDLARCVGKRKIKIRNRRLLSL